MTSRTWQVHVARHDPASLGQVSVLASEYMRGRQEHKIKILIRRAGPNYLEGLRKVKAASDKLGLGIKVLVLQCPGM